MLVSERIIKQHLFSKEISEAQPARSENREREVTAGSREDTLKAVYDNIELLGSLSKATQSTIQRLNGQIKSVGSCEDMQPEGLDDAPSGNSSPAFSSLQVDILDLLKNFEISFAMHELACLGPEIRVQLENLTQELQMARQMLQRLANHMSEE